MYFYFASSLSSLNSMTLAPAAAAVHVLLFTASSLQTTFAHKKGKSLNPPHALGCKHKAFLNDMTASGSASHP
jgi:hypothetical protein